MLTLKPQSAGVHFPKTNAWMDSFFENEFPSFDPLFKGQSFVKVNTKETKDNFQLEVAAPGFKRENFALEVDNQLLHLTAEYQQDGLQEGDRYTRKEYHFASFKRSFTLPKTVDSTKIAATYKDGILNVTIPKMEEAKAKEKMVVPVS